MKKKPAPKPVPKHITAPQDASDLEMWQAQYGGDWQKITVHPAFQSGLQLMKLRKLNWICALSDEEISKYAPEILADARGYMKHSNELTGLHVAQEFKFPLEEEDVYISPEEEAAHQQLRNKFVSEERKKRYGN